MFTTNRTDNITVLKLEGRFDAYQVPQVNEWLAEHLEVQFLVVDLSDVNFMDTMALATLVKWMKKTRELEGDLKLCGLQQAVRIIFELSRLDKAFDIHDTKEDALTAFTQGMR